MDGTLVHTPTIIAPIRIVTLTIVDGRCAINDQFPSLNGGSIAPQVAGPPLDLAIAMFRQVSGTIFFAARNGRGPGDV